MDTETDSGRDDLSSAKAVLIGTLASGVNGPTWNTLKIAFFMLSESLVAMLVLAFSSSDSALIIHVAGLVLITATLFFLLSRLAWFQWNVNCMVSVERQLQEIGLASIDIGNDEKDKSC